MQAEIDKLVETIKADYAKCDWSDEMINTFNDSIEVLTGKKYIKIVKKSSVWGFIVNVDNDAKFKRGDILMAAGYKAPARNHARGNVFTGYEINWTGPVYMGGEQQAKNEVYAKLAPLDEI